ncbi:hypothetical protein CYMTET_12966 [Cymbomonas tetramitiformis]|uniref:Uncharacterized protein n=1 Tax=Cymbomonas tetramitiformis TaxID=36881 RepID=A0AAE0GJ98_9CHLO|nr:hypothetical protein CYMTET_12966 [Cymbomonas tetramitiformis]
MHVSGAYLQLICALLLLLTPSVLAKWTVLVYEVADNELDCAAMQDLQELLLAAEDIQAEIVVLADRAAEDSWSFCGVRNFGGITGWGSGTKELRLRSGGSAELLHDHGELDLGKKSVLGTFISRSIIRFPADDYALILWDHGNAWRGFGGDATPGIYQGGQYWSTALSLSELKSAIHSGLVGAGASQFSLIGFDACLMQSYAVTSMLSHLTAVVVASEELEPGHGWDYSAFSILGSHPSISPIDLGQTICDKYKQQAARSGTDTITLSVINIAEFLSFRTGFQRLIDALATALQGTELDGQDALVLGLAEVQSSSLEMIRTPGYDKESLLDLGMLLRGMNVEGWKGAAAIPEGLLDELIDSYDRAIAHQVTDVVMAQATGLSIYFPRTAAEYEYAYCYITAVRHWCEFLQAYFAAAARYADDNGAMLLFSEASAPIQLVPDPDYPGITLYALVGELGTGTAVDAKLRYGFEDAAGRVLFLGELPAYVQQGVVVAGVWDGIIFGLEQASEDEGAPPIISPIYSLLKEEYDENGEPTDGASINALVMYRNRDGRTERGFLRASFSDSAVVSLRLFVTTESGIVEVFPGAGGAVQPYLLQEVVNVATGEVKYTKYFGYCPELGWGADAMAGTLRLKYWHVVAGDLTGEADLGEVLPGLDRALRLQLEARSVVGVVAQLRSDPDSNVSSLSGGGNAQGAATLGGCRCRDPWDYYGSEFAGTCGNPDGDTVGTWCYLAADSCEDAGADVGPAGADWDYCRRHVAVPGEMVGSWVGEEDHPDGTCAIRISIEAGAVGTYAELRCSGEAQWSPYYSEYMLAVACVDDGAGFYESYTDSAATAVCTKFEHASDGALHLFWLAQDLPGGHPLAGAFDCRALEAALKQHPDAVAHSTLYLGDTASGVPHAAWSCAPKAVPGELVGSWSGPATFIPAVQGASGCEVQLVTEEGGTAVALVMSGDCGGGNVDEGLERLWRVLDYEPESCDGEFGGGVLNIATGSEERCVTVERSKTALQLMWRQPVLDAPAEDIRLPRLPCVGASHSEGSNATAGFVVVELAAAPSSALPVEQWACAAVPPAPPAGPVATVASTAVDIIGMAPLARELWGSWEGSESYGFEVCDIRVTFNSSDHTTLAVIRCEGDTEWAAYYQEQVIGSSCSGGNHGYYRATALDDPSVAWCTKWAREGMDLTLNWVASADKEDCQGIDEALDAAWGTYSVVATRLRPADVAGQPGVVSALEATHGTCVAQQAAPPELAGRWRGVEAWIASGERHTCSVNVTVAAGAPGEAEIHATYADGCSVGRVVEVARQRIFDVEVERCEGPADGRVSRGVLRAYSDGWQMCLLFQRNGTRLEMAYSSHLRNALPSFTCPPAPEFVADGYIVAMHLELAEDALSDDSLWLCHVRPDDEIILLPTLPDLNPSWVTAQESSTGGREPVSGYDYGQWGYDYSLSDYADAVVPTDDAEAPDSTGPSTAPSVAPRPPPSYALPPDATPPPSSPPPLAPQVSIPTAPPTPPTPPTPPAVPSPSPLLPSTPSPVSAPAAMRVVFAALDAELPDRRDSLSASPFLGSLEGAAAADAGLPSGSVKLRRLQVMLEGRLHLTAATPLLWTGEVHFHLRRALCAALSTAGLVAPQSSVVVTAIGPPEGRRTQEGGDTSSQETSPSAISSRNAMGVSVKLEVTVEASMLEAGREALWQSCLDGSLSHALLEDGINVTVSLEPPLHTNVRMSFIYNASKMQLRSTQLKLAAASTPHTVGSAGSNPPPTAPDETPSATALLEQALQQHDLNYRALKLVLMEELGLEAIESATDALDPHGDGMDLWYDSDIEYTTNRPRRDDDETSEDSGDPASDSSMTQALFMPIVAASLAGVFVSCIVIGSIVFRRCISRHKGLQFARMEDLDPAIIDEGAEAL